MDQCIVAMHSMGTLKRGKNLNKYLNKISEDFVLLSNVLHQRGIKLAVATHSDSMEYNRRGPLNISRSTHIMGEDLVEMVLERSVPALLPYFKVIAYNPRVRGDKDVNNAHKKLHLRQIATYYNVSQNECLLFDDDKGNVMDTDERFYGIRVDEKHAFRLSPELFQTIASKINRDVKTASIGESLTSLTHLSNSLIYDVDNFREYWKDNNIINIEYLCPNTASDTQLSNLPPTLITVGESEIMVDDIELFSNRLIKLHNNRHSSSSSTSSSTFMEIASYLVKGEGDVHVYPTLWRHPFHRVMSPLGLQWLFNLVFPQRALISKELKAVYKKGRDGFELIDSNTEIHSKTADDAIVEIAKFIIKIKKSLDINT